jgi:VanZ family protein
VDPVAAIARRLRAMPRAAGAALALGWIALVWFLSAQPPGGLVRGRTALHWLHNLAHAVEFGALALWLALAARPAGEPLLAAPGAARAILAFCAVYGALDEFHQSFTPGRDASVCDVLTDCAGAATVLLALCALRREPWDRPALARALVLGGAACALAAALATFVPTLFPEATWL